jgi:hypothetical protein
MSDSVGDFYKASFSNVFYKTVASVLSSQTLLNQKFIVIYKTLFRHKVMFDYDAIYIIGDEIKYCEFESIRAKIPNPNFSVTNFAFVLTVLSYFYII